MNDSGSPVLVPFWEFQRYYVPRGSDAGPTGCSYNAGEALTTMRDCRHTSLYVSTVRKSRHSCIARFLLSILVITAAAGLTIGCGLGERTSPPPQLTGNTRVTVAVSSTANDRLFHFGLGFTNISLVNQRGNTISLMSGDLSSELIHLNGDLQPLLTANIPQDVYTSASVTIGGAMFGCLAEYPPTGGILIAYFAYGATPKDHVKVNLPGPITVTGDSMGLVLDLQVSQSATFSCYNPDPLPSFSITPTFELTPIVLSPLLGNLAAGKVLGIDGKITSIDPEASSFSLNVTGNFEDIGTVSVSFAAGTVFQGLSSASALSVGTFVDLDGVIQPDGSVLASRIEVQDPSAINMERGPLLNAPAAVSYVQICGRQDWAVDLSSLMGCGGPADISSTHFAISGQVTNLGDLPFVPVFDRSSVVAGQEVSVSYTRGSAALGPYYATARTITLMPQTMNARVVASAQFGEWTVYTVSLAPYSLFPVLASQNNQIAVPTRPDQVQVYVHTGTLLLNREALAPGSTLRFYGPIFYDNGTLRMDCLQVSDGVPQ